MPVAFELNYGAEKLVFADELSEAKILQRPNRYVAMVELSSGKTVRAHVPVGGRIGGLTPDGLPCLLSGPYANRSTDYTVEAIGSHYSKDEDNFQWIFINQTASNGYVDSLLRNGIVPELYGAEAESLKREKILGGKRIDFFSEARREQWIEVKTPLISLATELSKDLPIKTDWAKGSPSKRLPEQFEALRERVELGARVVFLGVFGYRRSSSISAEERYRANLDLDGLVDVGLELGMEFWEMELEADPDGLQFKRAEKLFLP